MSNQNESIKYDDPLQDIADKLNTIVGTPKATFDRLLKTEFQADVIAVYLFYCYTGKWQKTNKTFSTTGYVAKGLGLTELRVRRAKKTLKSLDLIEDVQSRDEHNKITGWYIHVKHISKTLPTEGTTLTIFDRVDNRKGNALSTNSKYKVDTNVSIMGVKYSLKQLQIKYNPILNRTMIVMGGYKTRINDNKSKTMISVYKHLVRLQHNKFLTGKNFDTKPSLKSRDTYQIEKVMTDDQLEALLKKAAKRWWLIFTDENYNSPENRPGLNDFFYNEETKMSYFIYCSCCTLLKKKESNQINKLESLKLGLRKLEPKLKELSLKLYSSSIINGFNVEDSMAFYSNIKNLITWRLENKDHLEKVNEGWVTLFGVNRLMFNTVSRFMQEQGTEYLPNFLIVDGYLWDDFNEWCIDGYGVNLKLKGK